MSSARHHARGIDAIVAKPGDEDRRLAMAVRDGGDQALVRGAAAIAARHVGRCAGLVHEGRLNRVRAGLCPIPSGMRCCDSGALLLGGVGRHFSRVRPRATR